MADGKQLVAKSNYFAMACVGYTILTLEVWGIGYGKNLGKLFAWSLVIWVAVGLYIPAFWLLVAGTLPF